MEFENFEYVENSVRCDFIDLVTGMSQKLIFSCYSPYDMAEQGGYNNTSSQGSEENMKMTPLSFLKASSSSD